MDFYQKVSRDSKAILCDSVFIDFVINEVSDLDVSLKKAVNKGYKVPSFANEVLLLGANRIIDEYGLIIDKECNLPLSCRELIKEIIHSAINKTLKHYGVQKDSDSISHDPEASV